MTGTEHGPEVRPEEETRGIADPIDGSAFGPALVEALRQPLDPERIRRRKGRGSGQFDYLAGHDVKRRANELFGFGKWGHHVLDLTELGAVEVKSENGKDGWHVGYRCTVEVWIWMGPDPAFTTHGVGYGDGVEYTAAARVTACELAIKEAETDALKRAFTDLGDQFGLILYAKADEKKRIERDQNAETSTVGTGRVGRRENMPTGWAELIARWAWLFGGPSVAYAVDTAKAWMGQAALAKFGLPVSKLEGDEKFAAAKLLGDVLLDLEESGADLIVGVEMRKTVRDAFAKYLDGAVLDGPTWAMESTETDRPQFATEASTEPASATETPAELPADAEPIPAATTAGDAGDDVPFDPAPTADPADA